MRLSARFLWTAVMVLQLATIRVYGQTSLGTASLGGSVTDSSGSVIPNARVELTDVERGLTREAVTNDAGNYVYTGLQAGRFLLRVTKEGFEEFRNVDFQIAVNQRATVDAVLKVGVVNESVSVNAQGETPMLETASNALGAVIDNRRVEELPLNGRNFLQLAVLSGGVETPPGGAPSDRASAQIGRGGRTINISGNVESVTSYLIDGIATRGSRLGESSLNLSVADIDQFKLQMSFFMPDQGPNPGIVNVVTKSGTNRLHGEAFEFVRNGALDARNFYAPSAEQLQRNQFGFALGGPVFLPKLFDGRNRLWFHTHYEGTRQIQKFSQRGFTPTAAMFGGDLSQVPETIYNPFNFDAATGRRAAFPNNQIPPNLINPVAKNLLAYYLPGSSYSQRPSNLFANPRNTLNDDQWSVRGDYAVSSRHMIAANLLFENSPAVQGGLFPLAGSFFPSDTQVAVVQDTLTISPTLVNLARIGFSRSSVFSKGEGAAGSGILDKLGVAGTLDTRGVVGVSIQGYSGFGRSSGPLGDVDNSYQIDEGLNWSRGNHTFQFGGGIRYHRTVQQNANANALGSLSFQTVFTAQLARNAAGQLAPQANTGNAFADFLLGIPTSGQVVGLQPFHYRYTEWFPYVQDSWKLSRSLTVNWGLSWYYGSIPNPQGADRKVPHGFDFQTGLLRYAALGEVDPKIIKPDYKDWTPRAGFAWQPSFMKNTVIRSGAGIYYATGALIEAQFGMVAPPFQNSLSIANNQFQPAPAYVLGQNVFPLIPLPPLTSSFAATLPQGFTPFAVSPDLKTPYVVQWNFSIQHTFGHHDLAQIDYVGTSGHRQQDRYDVDQCQVSTAGRCDPATRPYPRYNYILFSNNTGNLSYEAVIGRYQHQFSRGLTVLANYTFSKAITDGWEGGGSTQSQIATCRRCDRGPVSYDVPHHFVASSIYELPLGRGKLFGSHWNALGNALAGGWTVNAIVTLATGNALTVTAPNRTGSNFTSVRADRLCDGRSDQLSGQVRSNGGRWFDASCFAAPQPGFFGNSGRGVLFGPGANNWDIGIQKNFRIVEAIRFELRGELFNAFNHTQFNNPDANAGDLNFGLISGARAPRLVQLGGRLVW